MTHRSVRPLPGLRRLALALLVLPLGACIGNRVIHPILPTADEVAAFEAAGPDMSTPDPDSLVALNLGGTDYAVVAGDLLEVELPGDIVDIESEELSTTIKSRVREDGTVRLPVAGEVSVAGLTPATIEQRIAAAVVESGARTEEPRVVVTVAKYRETSVAVFGAVANAGLHALRSDRMSLLGALMAAGGIREDGAESIRVLRPTEPGEAPEVQVLAVRGSSIPLSDVQLSGGETIVVEPRVEQQFTIIGLVKRPGQQTYPQNRTYNLMQALAVAGGTDPTAAPRYATIYRKDGDTVRRCNFKIDGTDYADAANVLVKPGDVIAVEHTQGTWTRTFLSSIFGFRLSASASSSSQV